MIVLPSNTVNTLPSYSVFWLLMGWNSVPIFKLSLGLMIAV